MINRRTFAIGVGSAGVALTAGALYESGTYLLREPRASLAATPQSLMSSPINPAWVMSGTPKISMYVTAQSPDGRTATGVWVCEGPTTFEWRFGVDEMVHLLEGFVEVEYLGRRFVLRAGDSATFVAGTRAVWHVPERMKKVFTLQQPGKLVQWWRWWTRFVPAHA